MWEKKSEHCKLFVQLNDKFVKHLLSVSVGVRVVVEEEEDWSVRRSETKWLLLCQLVFFTTETRSASIFGCSRGTKDDNSRPVKGSGAGNDRKATLKSPQNTIKALQPNLYK